MDGEAVGVEGAAAVRTWSQVRLCRLPRRLVTVVQGKRAATCNVHDMVIHHTLTTGTPRVNVELQNGHINVTRHR